MGYAVMVEPMGIPSLDPLIFLFVLGPCYCSMGTNARGTCSPNTVFNYTRHGTSEILGTICQEKPGSVKGVVLTDLFYSESRVILL